MKNIFTYFKAKLFGFVCLVFLSLTSSLTFAQDGTLDTSFVGSVSGEGNTVYAISRQTNGKIIIGGSFISVNGIARNNITRLNTNGTLDSGFGNGLSGANAPVYAIGLQNDGKIIIAGGFTSVNGIVRNRIARLNADGTLDTGFGNGLTGTNNEVKAVALQSDGKILIGGLFTTVNGITRNRIARLNADGTLDTGFGNGLTGVNAGEVNAVALQTDGKIIIGGQFSSINGIIRNGIARLNTDGTLDNTFGNGLSGIGGSVYAVCLQNDGKIIVGGVFYTVNGISRTSLARLNSDGTIDNEYIGPEEVDGGAVYSIAMQNDGKILAGGVINAESDIVRVNTNGTLDTSFNIENSFGANIVAIALQEDGKILIGGYFTLSRLLSSSGNSLPTFTPSSGCANTTPVVILGTGFTGTTAVTFGGIPASSFTVNSATQITAIPASGNTGAISITTPSGTLTSETTFTVNPLTTIGSVTTSICTGESYVWPANGLSYNTIQTGTTFTSGCNTATLNLTINDTAQIFYADTDGDGFGAGAPIESCTGQPDDTSVNNTDCAPEDPLAWRIANFFVDVDGDTYNNGLPAQPVCYGALTPAGYVAVFIATDCDDQLATVNPNASEVLGNGIDDNCDGVTDEVTPVSSLSDASCGALLTNISATLYAYQMASFPGVGTVQGYRFRVTLGANVRTFDSPVSRFSLTNLAGGVLYATTYTVDVSLKTNNHYRAYGPTCTVTTPAVPSSTNIANPACGSTLANISNTIWCNAVASASGYRFRVRNGATVVGTVDTTVNRFSLTSIAGIQFGTTYTIDVLLAFGGNFRPESEYGATCEINTPATPGTSRVANPSCGSTISSFWTTIYAQQVIGAQGYRFVVTNGAQTRQFDTPNSRFALRNLTGIISPSTTYTIRVDVLYNSSYVEGVVTCDITTTAGASREANAALAIYEVAAYPNPYADTFKLDVNTSSEGQVGVSVYDMLGRAVESREASVDNITNLEIGSRYPSGVYNIVVTQGAHIKTLRVIKR